MHYICHKTTAPDYVEDTEHPDEESHLLGTAQKRRSSAIVLEQKVEPSTEANRWLSVTMMGIPQFDTPKDQKRQSSVLREIAKELLEDEGLDD